MDEFEMTRFADFLAGVNTRADYVALAANAKRRLNRLLAMGEMNAAVVGLADFEKCFAALVKNCGGRKAAAEMLVANRVATLAAYLAKVEATGWINALLDCGCCCDDVPVTTEAGAAALAALRAA